MKKKSLVIGVVFFMMAVVLPAVVCAAEITIDYVTFVPRMHGISKILLEDLKEIEGKSGGKLKFNYRGGPEAIKTFAQAKAVRDGAVDMCVTSPDFYGKIVKGMGALSLSKLPVSKHREKGVYDYMNSKFNPIGIQFLYMVPKEQNNMFHLYSKKPINTPADFKGLSIAGTGIFDAIGPAFGMTPVAMQMNEQYTGMERGLIDVCRGGLDSVMAFKFYEVAKYIIKPGFGSAPASLFMNLKKWNSIPKDLQDLLIDNLYGMAAKSEAKHKAKIKGAFMASQKKGMKVVEFQGADRDYYIKTIEDAIYKLESKDDPVAFKKVYDLVN
ncbi:TRAP transporter substrate-binding protein [Thermodesulfobacteriota bacterium]